MQPKQIDITVMNQRDLAIADAVAANRESLRMGLDVLQNYCEIDPELKSAIIAQFEHDAELIDLLQKHGAHRSETVKNIVDALNAMNARRNH